MYTKVIQTGHTIEVFEYEKYPPIKLPSLKNVKKKNQKVFNYISARSARRRVVSFTRLVRGSIDVYGSPALLTLTFKDILSLTESQKHFGRFMTRLKRRFPELEYISVVEFQKRGAVHFHVLLFNLDDLYIRYERKKRFFAKLWGFGFVDILRTDGSYKLAGYLSKYLRKSLSDQRLCGRRGYNTSRRIIRPVVVKGANSSSIAKTFWGIKDSLIPVDKRLEYISQYGTKYLGRCIYKRYKL